VGAAILTAISWKVRLKPARDHPLVRSRPIDTAEIGTEPFPFIYIMLKLVTFILYAVAARGVGGAWIFFAASVFSPAVAVVGWVGLCRNGS